VVRARRVRPRRVARRSRARRAAWPSGRGGRRVDRRAAHRVPRGARREPGGRLVRWGTGHRAGRGARDRVRRAGYPVRPRGGSAVGFRGGADRGRPAPGTAGTGRVRPTAPRAARPTPGKIDWYVIDVRRGDRGGYRTTRSTPGQGRPRGPSAPHRV